MVNDGDTGRSDMARTWAAAMFLALSFAGCGSGGSTTVAGRITYRGTPLNSGRIYFNVGDGQVVRSAVINRDGSYVVSGLPAGTEASVAVSVPPAASSPGGPDAPQVAAPGVVPVAIPSRYERIETAGLSARVEAGRNEFDIELE